MAPRPPLDPARTNVLNGTGGRRRERRCQGADPCHSLAPVQLEFLLPAVRGEAAGQPASALRGLSRPIPVVFVRNARARRYVLRVLTQGLARVTIPRGGSLLEGRAFAERQIPWLERQLERQARLPRPPRVWRAGSSLLFRGEPTVLEVELVTGLRRIRFADQTIDGPPDTDDLRPAVEAHLWRLAAQELPPRVFELASQHQAKVRRVSVRAQRSRWGSCSRHGTISLNWHLIQTPPWVRDYLIVHELMHLREMNHSRRFWRHVATACPTYADAEAWLKRHEGLLK